MRTLEFLKPGQCRFAMRRTEIDGQFLWLFCAEKVVEGKSYCAQHCAVCRQVRQVALKQSEFLDEQKEEASRDGAERKLATSRASDWRADAEKVLRFLRRKETSDYETRPEHGSAASRNGDWRKREDA
jgi:hypothetical protein